MSSEEMYAKDSKPSIPLTPRYSQIPDSRSIDSTDTISIIRRSAKAMIAITFFEGLAQIAIVLSLYLIVIDGGWTTTPQGYRFILPAAIGILMFGAMIYSYSHNMKRIFELHNILAVIWLIILIVLTVWAIVDVAWFCPSKLPDFCTDTVVATIEIGYWVYATGIWVGMIAYIADLAVMASIERQMELMKSTWTEAEFQQIWKDAFHMKSTSHYITGIGSSAKVA